MNRANWFSVVPTIDTAAYASGELVGTKMEFDLSAYRDVENLLIKSAIIVDKAAQAAAIDLVLFGEDPSGTTFTDNAAFDPADADLDNLIGVISFAAASYQSYADNAACLVTDLAVPIPLNIVDSSLKIYGALVSRGAPTYAADSDLTVRLGVAAAGRMLR